MRTCVLDFGGSWDQDLPFAEIAYSNSYCSSIGMIPFKAFYDRSYQSSSSWNEIGNRCLPRTNYVQEIVDKLAVIRKDLITAQGRQKSYANNRRRPLEFAIDDHVYLKVFSYKGRMRFGKRGKLSSRFVGPFESLERVVPVAYRLALPPEFARLYDVFHVFVLIRYHHNSSHVIPHQQTLICSDIAYAEYPNEVIDWTEKVLGNRRIPKVKMLWQHHTLDEVTWELEDEMQDKYVELF